MADRIGKPISQRQLRVGEMIKQSLSMIFIRNEAKVPNLALSFHDGHNSATNIPDALDIDFHHLVPLGFGDIE